MKYCTDQPEVAEPLSDTDDTSPCEKWTRDNRYVASNLQEVGLFNTCDVTAGIWFCVTCVVISGGKWGQLILMTSAMSTADMHARFVSLKHATDE